MGEIQNKQRILNLIKTIEQKNKLIENLRKDKIELFNELKFKNEIEMEAVRRYHKQNAELLEYYKKYGILHNIDKKK